MKRYFVVSALLFVAALAGGLLMLSGMSGPHMGAAVLAGYLVMVLGALGANLFISFVLVLPRAARWPLLGVAAIAGAAFFVQWAWNAAQKNRAQAKHGAAMRVESEWQEKIVSLPRDELLRWLSDGTFDERRPPAVSPLLGLHDRVSAMAYSCKLDPELLAAIERHVTFVGDAIIDFLDDARDCPSKQRGEWLAHFRSTLFAVTDATQRWELAQNLLRVDASGDYLRQFVAAGYAIDSAAPDHPPLIFDVLKNEDAPLAPTRVLINLGARRDVKNDEGLTPAAFLERRAKQMFSEDAGMPEEWRATLALLKN